MCLCAKRHRSMRIPNVNKFLEQLNEKSEWIALLQNSTCRWLRLHIPFVRMLEWNVSHMRQAQYDFHSNYFISMHYCLIWQVFHNPYTLIELSFNYLLHTNEYYRTILRIEIPFPVRSCQQHEYFFRKTQSSIRCTHNLFQSIPSMHEQIIYQIHIIHERFSKA